MFSMQTQLKMASAASVYNHAAPFHRHATVYLGAGGALDQRRVRDAGGHRTDRLDHGDHPDAAILVARAFLAARLLLATRLEARSDSRTTGFRKAIKASEPSQIARYVCSIIWWHAHASVAATADELAAWFAGAECR